MELKFLKPRYKMTSNGPMPLVIKTNLHLLAKLLKEKGIDFYWYDARNRPRAQRLGDTPHKFSDPTNIPRQEFVNGAYFYSMDGYEYITLRIHPPVDSAKALERHKKYSESIKYSESSQRWVDSLNQN
jgi:hypothetical protein